MNRSLAIITRRFGCSVRAAAVDYAIDLVFVLLNNADATESAITQPARLL